VPNYDLYSADRWLRQQFTRRDWILDQIKQIIADQPPLLMSTTAPCVFGWTFEYGLHFDLSIGLPHVDKLRAFPRSAARVFAGLAGYGPPTGDPHAPWPTWTRRCGRQPSWHRMHLPAYTLSFLGNFFKPPQCGTHASDTRTFLWAPGMRDSVLARAAVEEAVFTAFMDSYATVARPVLDWWGRVTPALQLPGGRTADLRAGRTIVEVKTGWLTGDDEPDRLIDQLLGYGLLSQLTDQPARYVAAYLARYETLRRYRFDDLAARCLRTRADTTAMAREYLALHERRTP
jgi:hypothetical protein